MSLSDLSLSQYSDNDLTEHYCVECCVDYNSHLHHYTLNDVVFCEPHMDVYEREDENNSLLCDCNDLSFYSITTQTDSRRDSVKSVINNEGDRCNKTCRELLSQVMPEAFEQLNTCVCKEIRPYVNFAKKISNCKGLSIAHLNVRSLLPKINQIRMFLCITKIDMLCINEAWLDSTVTNKDINVCGYEVYRNDRTRWWCSNICQRRFKVK